MKYNKISGFSDEISENVREQFETLNRLGIKYFEPRGVDGKNISELSGGEVSALREKMREYGISVSSIGSPIGKIGICDPFEPHFECFKRVVEIAESLDTRFIRIFSFYIPDGGKAEEWRGEVTERLGKMRDYAKTEDVVLLHENEKGIYGDNADRCADIFDALYSENFRGVFDPANFVQCGQDTKEAFARLEKYIAYVHIKDAAEDGCVVPAGKGAGNVEFILKRLIDSGYDGFLSLEPHLGSFSGFEKLERGAAEKKEMSSAEKFILAYNSLNEILERI